MCRACAVMSPLFPSFASFSSLLEVKKWRLFRSATFSPGFAGFEAYSVFLRIAHFTVTGYEARVDLVLIHFFLRYSVNHALLMQTDIL